MGRQQFSIDKIFINRPKMKHYPLLTGDVKDVVDYTIRESLKANPIIRINRFIGYKKVKPKKSDLWFLTWSDLIALREAVREQDIFEIMKIVYLLNPKKIAEVDVFNCFAAYTWITKQMIEIHKIEMDMLYEDPTEDEKEAGVEKLQEFSYTVALDNLANGDVLKYDEYLKLPYAKIFRKLCLNKTNNDIQKQYQENVSRKARNNSRG